MNKPTYYLWQDSSCSDEEIQKRKEELVKYGFHVVIFQDGERTDIQECIKNIIKNHKSEH